MSSLRYLLGWTLLLGMSSVFGDEYSLIHAGRLMDVPGESLKESYTVVVRDGKIEDLRRGYVQPDAFELTPSDSIVVHDLRDMLVMPGFIDGHVHITDELGAKTKLQRVEFSDPDTALFGAHNAKLTLEAGFTTVRDLGGRGGDAVFALRDAIAKGYVPGPRIFAAGDVISPTGGHGQRHGYRDDVFEVMHHTGICDGVADCRRAVRDQVRRSADQIKFVSTGGVLSETATGTGKQFFDDELKTIVDTGHSLGRKVTAHAHGTDGINAALRAGVDSIEHGSFSNEESFRLFRETGAYLVPTVLAGVTASEMAADVDSFMAPPVREKALAVGPEMIEMLRRAHNAGVKIAFGTDSYVSRHGDNAREFELMVRSGLSPIEAIQSATVNAAENLGQSAVMGTITTGKYADLVAVYGDPTEDIRELLDIDFVMKLGRIYKWQEADTRGRAPIHRLRQGYMVD